MTLRPREASGDPLRDDAEARLDRGCLLAALHELVGCRADEVGEVDREAGRLAHRPRDDSARRRPDAAARRGRAGARAARAAMGPTCGPLSQAVRQHFRAAPSTSRYGSPKLRISSTRPFGKTRLRRCELGPVIRPEMVDESVRAAAAATRCSSTCRAARRRVPSRTQALQRYPLQPCTTRPCRQWSA